VSIQNFNVMGGSALLNEQRVDMDFSLTNLAAVLNYHDKQQFLESHLRFDGVLDRSPDVKLSIPYTLSADMHYTRATLVAHLTVIDSGKNEVKLQGRINEFLSRNIAGKLDYVGNVEVPFLNYFFTTERFAGNARAAGSLEFSAGRFFTHGKAASESVD